MIKFAPGYKEAIENGTKKITIRKGIVNNLFPGGEETTNLNINLLIKSVRYCFFSSLTTEELLDDGFKNLKDCILTLKNFYKEVELYDLCTVIRFRVNNGG